MTDDSILAWLQERGYSSYDDFLIEHWADLGKKDREILQLVGVNPEHKK